MKYISERIWWGTNLPERNDGREAIKKLIEAERSAGRIPDWAAFIAENNIKYFPPCGHEMFEHNIIAILKAVKEQRKVEDFYYCFMVSGEALAKAQEVIERCGKNEGTTAYNIILARRLRWWMIVNSKVKENPFINDDARSDYYDWDESSENEIRKSGLSLDDRLLKNIKNTWLCAPKAFRFIEKIGNEIGIQLDGSDSYSKHSFKAKITDSIRRIEDEMSVAEKNGDIVAVFLLTLLRVKLNEYVQNGILQKVVKA